MIDTTDILLKASEDVQSGMWCKGSMFRHPGEETGTVMIPGEFTPEEVARMERCAIGSLAYATALLGGDADDYRAACQRVSTWIELPPRMQDMLDAQSTVEPEATIVQFNDAVLPDDPFEAGQQLADLFRRAAEGL